MESLNRDVEMTGQRSDGPPAVTNAHLPPHLREVCAVLAAGLLRLHRRAAEDNARDGAQASERGESSLHFPGHQSGHVNRRTREPA